MARDIKRVSGSPPKGIGLNLEKFDAGRISLLSESRLPPNAASESKNLMQYEDGIWGTPWGSRAYGKALSADCDGATQYVDSDNNTELIACAGGSVYRSTDEGNWSAISGGSYTAGEQCFFLQIGGNLYITTGTDNILRYNGSTISTYSALSNPSAPTLNRGAGLSAGSFNNYYQVVATNEVGFTAASTEANLTTNIERDTWDETDEYIDVVITRVTGALRYDVYYADASGFEVYLGSIADPGSGGTVTFQDDGSAVPNDFTEAPADNTTTGPQFKHMELSGNRIWATGDSQNPHRVYWGGAGQYQGFFSIFYGGGYVDLEKGGKDRPTAVVDYRDGKGTPFLTVLTSDPAGNGSVWQVGLETATIGDTSFIVPNPQKLVGSVGTNAPLSVVKVRNDVLFANPRGAHSIGSKPSVLNVLATDELSANIRPDWRGLIGSAMDKVASYYYDAKVWWAVPVQGTNNSHLFIYDTERKNWSLRRSLAVRQFLEYTDTSGETHFLAVPSGGDTLLKVSDALQNDEGSAIDTRFRSALLPVVKDRFKWAQVTKAYFEFTELMGTVQLSVLGTQKNKEYSTVVSETVSATTSDAGFGADLFGDPLFGETTSPPSTFTLGVTKKWVRINKLLNNIQLQVSSDATNTQWRLVSAKVEGYEVPTTDPENWRTA